MPLCRLVIYPTALFALFLFSCTKKDIPGPQGPSGPQGPAGTNAVQKGNLQGKIFLYDTLGNHLTDNSGATVSIEHISPLIQATTATDGSFTLDSVNEGIYSLSVQKQGFGTMRFFNLVNTGTIPPSRIGGLNLTQQMSSNFDLKSLTIDSSAKPSLSFTVILSHPKTSVKASLLVYVNDSTGVGNGRCKFVFWMSWTQINDSTLKSSSWPLSINTTFPQLGKSNFFYFTAALDNPVSAEYMDELGNYVAPSIAKPAPEIILNNSQHVY